MEVGKNMKRKQNKHKKHKLKKNNKGGVEYVDG